VLTIPIYYLHYYITTEIYDIQYIFTTLYFCFGKTITTYR